ncbi:MAG: DUF302 domain-containing protein [Ardenticatenaceae bacterium]|nr:DUF302 domain-containing protein [Ardenticatenaceae bacterium]MCB9003785.1 DUF302 domain-containing protein [Ardenticatenaceae bacterium]
MTVYLDSDFETAVTTVTSELKKEGFGVLTEIDVKATLKKKMDMDFRPYKILGACNPPLAHAALSAVPEVGLLLPCNVTVALEEDGRILVSLIDPEVMLGIVDNPAIVEVAQDAKARLARVAAALAA